MALESFGTSARMIDNAVKLLHDLLLERNLSGGFDPANPGKGFDFQAGEEGIWRVIPSVLDGKPAIEIRLGVG
jgi:hypothetical protein